MPYEYTNMYVDTPVNRKTVELFNKKYRRSFDVKTVRNIIFLETHYMDTFKKNKSEKFLLEFWVNEYLHIEDRYVPFWIVRLVANKC